MEYIELNNGVKMPMLGYGTYQTPASRTEECVTEAIHLGYRSIDTAQCYGNEKEVGTSCRKSGIPREEFFITTKLWGCRGYQDTLRSIESSVKRLNMDYIDLLLIHEPTGNVHEIYRAMETCYKEGKIRAIGVSNFLEDRYLDLVNHCKVIPVRLVVIPLVTWCFLHLFISDTVLIAICTISSGMSVASLVAMMSVENKRQNQSATIGIALSTIVSMITIPIMAVLLT